MIANGHLLSAYISDISTIESRGDNQALSDDYQWCDEGVTSYICYARFTRLPGGGFEVEIPEFEGCMAFGDSFESARHNAMEELNRQVVFWLQQGNKLPDTIPRIGKDFHPLKILL